jgi:hypothetical protein
MQRKYMEESRGAKPTVNGPTRQLPKPTNQGRVGLDAAKAPPFNAANAPEPAECFKEYIAVAKRATTMEQVLPYLPEARQRGLKADQSSYDPKRAAKSREERRKRNPDLTEQQLAHLTDPPYTTALKFQKGLAEHIIDVLSAKTEGNKAKLVVATSYGATVNGERYGFSTADVEMVGEGRLWKMTRFEPSIVHYKELPTKP